MTIDQFNNYLVSSKLTCKNGVWYSPNSKNLSYPEDGNDNCFQLEEKSFWFRHRNNTLIAVIKKYCSNTTFFDVGGGNGFVTKAIEDAHISAVLIEPGKKGVQNATKRKLSTIFCGTLQDLKGLAGTLGAIGSFDVIEHIKDDQAFVNNVYEMLFDGGYFFVTVPAFQSLWSDEDVNAGHFRRYNLKSIVNLLKESGFEIEYSTYFFLVFFSFLFF